VLVGSRNRHGSQFKGPAPVLAVDCDALDTSGHNNLQEVLEALPMTGNVTFSTRANNQHPTANGIAAVSLRGLGADAWSDALAGVVNNVLRRNFEGLEIAGSYGATAASGMDELAASAFRGTGDDTGNVTVMFN